MNRREFLLGTAAGLVGAVPVRGEAVPEAAGAYDVIVAGGGPAGVSAALAAAKAGAKVHVFESHGCLGGVWTSGLMACMIAFNKSETDREIARRLDKFGARLPRREKNPEGNFLCEPEYLKYILEEMCAEAGVTFTYHAPVVAAQKDATGRRIVGVWTESKSGRQLWTAKQFIDTTGDGDLAARAGCGFDMGITPDGFGQPASLMSFVMVPDYERIKSYVVTDPMNWGLKVPGRTDTLAVTDRVRAEIRRAGVDCSYSRPTFFRLHGNLLQFAVNHEYRLKVDDAQAITNATVRARREHMTVVTALAGLGGVWEGLRLVATAEQIAHRTARRIHGRYTITAQDVAEGRTFEDGICLSPTGVDIHGLTREANETCPAGNPFRNRHKPFQIPLRACRAADVDNLWMAGRCISGGFVAQASYRMTGTAVAMGEAVGRAAARA